MDVFVSTGWSTDPCDAAPHVMSRDLVGLRNFRNVNWPGTNRLIQAAPFNTPSRNNNTTCLTWAITSGWKFCWYVWTISFQAFHFFVCVFMIGGGGGDLNYKCAGSLKPVGNHHRVESLQTSRITFKLIQSKSYVNANHKSPSSG